MFFPGISDGIIALLGYTKRVERGLIIKIYATILLIIFGGIIVHAPLSVYFGTLFPEGELLIKSWKEIGLIIALPFALWLIIDSKIYQQLKNDKLFQLFAVYIGLHSLFALALLTGPKATVAGMMIDLRYIVFFVYVYILLKLAPNYRKIFIKVFTIGAIIVVGFGALQLFLPKDILVHIGYGETTIQPYLLVDLNPNFVRINSTMRGPNPLGAYTVIVLGFIAAAVAMNKINLKERRELLIYSVSTLATLVVLWVSYSRSALVGALMTVALVGAIAFRRYLTKKVLLIGGVAALILISLVLLGRNHDLISNVIFHDNPADSNKVNSDDGHVNSLIDGTERMLRQPIGGGIGSTGSASLFSENPLIIENQYLFIAHEVGWLGLVLFIAITGLIFYRLWQKCEDYLALSVLASGIGLSLIGLLLPVWVDDTVSIIWWGLVAVALASSGGKYARTKTNQKTA